VRQREVEGAPSGALPPADGDEVTAEPVVEDDTPAFGARRSSDTLDEF
jgi:hypothetical protein